MRPKTCHRIVKSAWKIKTSWYPACPKAAERLFFHNEIYLHPLTWDIKKKHRDISRRSPSVSNLTQKSFDKMDQTNIVWPAYWRLEIPSGRVSFAGKVNSSYFQSNRTAETMTFDPRPSKGVGGGGVSCSYRDDKGISFLFWKFSSWDLFGDRKIWQRQIYIDIFGSLI